MSTSHPTSDPRVPRRAGTMAPLVGVVTGTIAVAVGVTLSPLVALVFVLVLLRSTLGWFRREHAALNAAGAGETRAVRRLVGRPALALVGLVLASLASQAVLDVKWSSFLWEGLPARTVDGVTYAWPGVYAAERVEHDNPSGASWYSSGGPYVPLPSEAPAAAAARVVRYLDERFDVHADAGEVERTLAENRGEPPPPGLRAGAGSADHPYTAGMAALERQYEPVVLRSLFSRSVAVSLALLLLGAAAIRIGIEGPPAWVESKSVGRTAAVLLLAFAVAWWVTDLSYTVFRAAVPVFRFHAEHLVATSAAVIAVSAWLLLSARSRARALDTRTGG